MSVVSQGISVSYNAVVNANKKAANQWADSSFLTELDRQGGIIHRAFGEQLEVTLDYQRNQGAAFLSSDLQTVATTKTEVVTSAVYDIAELCVPMVWSKKDEVKNSSDSQKVALVNAIITNGLSTHDDMLEQYIFATTTNGFLGLTTHIADAGTGSDGGIDSSIETWWKNKQSTYIDDTDIEATFTTVFNLCSKGSGSKLMPTLMVSDGATQALFEGTQQANQRYETQDMKAGFKTLMFKTAKYVFSQYGGTRVLFLNPKNFQLLVSKDYYKELSESLEFTNANGFSRKIYSAIQTVTNNRSRLGVAHV